MEKRKLLTPNVVSNLGKKARFLEVVTMGWKNSEKAEVESKKMYEERRWEEPAA